MIQIRDKEHLYLCRQKAAELSGKIQELDSEYGGVIGKIHAIDPLILGQKRVYSSWLPKWITNLGYSISRHLNKGVIENLLYKKDFYEQRFQDLTKAVTMVEQSIIGLEKRMEANAKQTQQSKEAEAGYTGALTTFVAAGVFGASLPAAVGFGATAAAARYAYRYWTSEETPKKQKEPVEQTAKPTTVTVDPTMAKNLLQQFFEGIPMVQKNPALRQLLLQLCNAPEGSFVEGNDKTVSIQLTQEASIEVNPERELSTDQLRQLSRNRAEKDSATPAIVADGETKKVKDLKQFGTIGKAAWTKAKGGISIGPTITLKRDGNSLHVQGIGRNLEKITFREDGLIDATIRIGVGRISTTMTDKYNLKDFALLISLMQTK